MKTMYILGETIEIHVSSSSTGNALCAGVDISPPGGGPPPHKHSREDELFFVLDGDYELYDGVGWSPMQRGVAHFAPRGAFHTFRNVGLTDGRLLFVAVPGGIDDYFDELAKLELPKDQAALDELNQRYGVQYEKPADEPDAAVSQC